MPRSTPQIATIQIGKNGLTENFFETLNGYFKKHLSVKVVVLKSASRDKSKIKEYSEKIIERLGNNYTSRTIGFTIIFKKWRKPVR